LYNFYIFQKTDVVFIQKVWYNEVVHLGSFLSHCADLPAKTVFEETADMFCENELHLLCDTLRKGHVRVSIGTPEELSSHLSDTGADGVLDSPLSGDDSTSRLLDASEPETVYRMVDASGLCFSFLRLCAPAQKKLLLIGPYLNAPPSQNQLLELGERLGISPKQQRYLEEYYQSIPVFSEGNPLFMLLDTFCERMWDRPSFAIVDVGKPDPPLVSPINAHHLDNGADEIAVNMKTMEKRYAFENEMIRAVSLGQLHKEKQLLSAFGGSFFEKRLTDPLRNAKNYAIIMNTLLRKAAESGGVHPLYLDRISSEFAARIEQLPHLSEQAALMREMFRSYCRLVRKHTLQKFSPVIQKTILLINSDLSANLSPALLAKKQNISAGYLSTVFRRETGKTVSEYVREKRMTHAAHLLETTNLQIQTVALHCGVMDVQYFSKLFKRYSGKTPREYRDTMTARGGI
jgi:AraC-like DNA-binding protein